VVKPPPNRTYYDIENAAIAALRNDGHVVARHARPVLSLHGNAASRDHVVYDDPPPEYSAPPEYTALV